MALIPATTIVAEFNVMLKEHWPYVWGAARKGCVDCSGAFVYVYGKYGKSIYHGSNRIARRYVEKLIPYEEAKAKGLIVPGMAAFKRRTPDDAKWDLPSSYRKGGAYYNGDLNDYYHIGLIDNDVDYVLNAQGSKTGFVRSPASQNWSHVACLSAVQYKYEAHEEPTREPESEVEPMQTAKVVGGALFLREKPEKGAAIVSRMEKGTRVQILEDCGDFCKVVVYQPEGYAMKKYLEVSDG